MNVKVNCASLALLTLWDILTAYSEDGQDLTKYLEAYINTMLLYSILHFVLSWF
jgi:hypothetical protein